LSFALSPEEIRARLLYRDDLMLVLDKPPGLPVHAGSGGGPTLEASFDALRFELTERPVLAHRLDRDTSGCLVLGRTRQAAKQLGRLFAEGRVEKLYWAVVEGGPHVDEGRIDLPLKKRDGERHSWRMMAAPDGQEAVTFFRVLGRAEGRSWLALRPLTGRTHQIRVHCAAMGFPVAGDWIYGASPADRRPQHTALLLHARAVTVPLHWKKPPVTAEAPPPPHMRAALQKLGFAD
jgi:tRNA pseudouridine32 synthase / 23S rRNA pseudouridine746 synthase